MRGYYGFPTNIKDKMVIALKPMFIFVREYYCFRELYDSTCHRS